MPDFTSALYLGFEHNSAGLPAWSRLTTGKPAALEETPGADGVQRQLAELVGCERALLGPSTLHLFWDLLALLAKERVSIFLDAASYPISRWAASAANASGARVGIFPAHDARSVGRAIAESSRPVIVTDGFSPALGRAAPLAEYARLASEAGGLVIVDDTQALGIFGDRRGSGTPYGSGGGGSLRAAEVSSERIVLISSLAKAFGAPLAMLAGNAGIVSSFGEHSLTRMHCSQPSAADVAAAANALAANRRRGDLLRRRLAERVAYLRNGLRRLGMIGIGSSWFPVQPVKLPASRDAMTVYEALLKNGVQTVAQRASRDGAAIISFVLTAQHRFDEIDQALECLKGFAGYRFRSWEQMNRTGERNERTIQVSCGTDGSALRPSP